MKFDAYSRRQAQVLFDTVATHAAESARKELDALRAEVEVRMAAMDHALAHPDHQKLLDRLVQELSAAARADADAARIEAETVAALARGEAQQNAEAALAAVRADGQAKVAAEQKTNAGLKSSLEEAQQKIQKLHAEQSAAHAAAKAAAQAAEAASQAAQAAAKADLDRARNELEGRLAQVQAARAELARVLTEAQREATNARAEASTHAASLKESQARVHSLEHEYTEILVARDDVARRLEAEVQRVATMTEAMAALRKEIGLAKQEASLSKVDAEGRRQGLEAATARIRILEEELRQSAESGSYQGPRPAVPHLSVATEESGVQLLDLVGTALESIDVAINANEILETLIEQLGRHFARAAVFLVGGSSFKGWKGTGLGAGTEFSNIEIPRTIDSILSRTLSERRTATVSGKAGDPAVGVLGNPVATALALPVFANGRVIAVAYAEHAEESSASLDVGCKIAEILIDHANRRLTVKRRTASPGSGQDVERLGGGAKMDARTPNYSPSRQASRVTLPQGMEVSLEGSASVLVDLSTLGAQVLSPIAMRPKRVVRLTLPTNQGGFVCKGRVVWAQFEQGSDTSEARYRAGLKFTEADSKAIEEFLARHGASPHDRVLAANLEESA